MSSPLSLFKPVSDKSNYSNNKVLPWSIYCEELEEQIRVLKENNNLCEQNRSLSEQNRSLNEKNNELTKLVNTLNGQVCSLSEQIRSLNEQICSLHSQVISQNGGLDTLNKLRYIKRLYRCLPGALKKYTQIDHKIIDKIMGSKFNINPFYAIHMLNGTDLVHYKVVSCGYSICYNDDVCNYVHSKQEYDFINELKKIKSIDKVNGKFGDKKRSI
jgi:hypothetical protein